MYFAILVLSSFEPLDFTISPDDVLMYEKRRVLRAF